MPASVDWGLREYGDALEAMRDLRRRRRSGAIADTLVLVEHPPVVTVGVQGDDGGTTPPGVPVFRVERGGKSTFHAPGQLVGYAIVDLEPRGRDVRRFVRDLEELVIRALGPQGVRADRVDGRRGVWVAGVRKIASIGIAVEEWVTFHGFALNVENDLAGFRDLRPCGFDGALMTSVSREAGRPVAVDEVKPGVVAAWTELFGRGAATVATAAPPLAPSTA